MLLKNHPIEPKVKDIEIRFIGNNMLGIINVDSQGQYTYLNKDAKLILGQNATNLVGKKIWEHFLDFGDRLNCECHNALSTKKTIIFEVFCQLLKQFLEIRIYPQEYNTISIYIVEITKFRQLEYELRETQKKLDAQYKYFPIPTYTWQRKEDDFILINYNNEADKITKGNIKKILGVKLSALYADQLEIIEDLHECFKTQKSFQKEILYKMKTTGENKYFKVTYVYIPNDLVMVHTQDITTVKIKEKQENCLAQIIESSKTKLNINELISTVVYNLCRVTDWDFGESWLLDQSQQLFQLNLNYLDKLNLEKLENYRGKNTLPMETGLLGIIYNSKLIEWHTNIDDEFPENENCPLIEKAKKLGVKAILGLPLIANSQVVAIIILYSYNPIDNQQNMINNMVALTKQFYFLMEGKKAEEDKKHSENRYSQIVTTTSEGIWVIDENSETIFVNQKMTKMLGYTTEEIIGKSIFDFMVKGQQNITIWNLDDVDFSDEIGLENDFQFKHKNGSVIWVLMSCSPLYKSSGEYEGLLIMINDITKRKKAELLLGKVNQNLGLIVKKRTHKLEKQLGFFRAIFDQAAVGICLNKVTGEILKANEYFYNLIGYSLAEIKCKSFLHFIEPSSRQEVVESLTELLKGNINNFSLETRYVCKTEKYQWVKINVSCIKNKQKKPEYILIIIENIEERREMLKKLEVSQRKYQTLFKILPVGVSVTDQKGNIIEANNKSEELLGISVANHTQKSLYDQDWQIVNSNNKPMSPAEYPAIKALETQENVENVEMGIVKPNGETTWICVNAAPIPMENYGTVIAYVDITERKQIEQWKDEFVSITSHELRTPLTSIKASLALLNTGKLGNLTEKGEKLLRFAYSDTNRLERLINDILQHQRLRFGQQIIHYSCHKTNNIIEKVINVIEPLAEQKGLNLCVSSEDLIVSADQDYLIQVLINLINNAVKFTETGKKIYLRCFLKDDEIVWEIEDEGIGIPEDKLESIFEPFRQIDSSNSREYHGTGLGLAISRSIVMAHNGKIWVESKLGLGSKFSFTIPVTINY